MVERVFVPMDDVFYAGEWEHSGHLTYSYATHHRHTCIGARAGFGDLLIGAGALMCEANGFDRNNITLKVGQSVRIPDKGKGAQASGTAQAAAASGKTPASAKAGKTPAAQAGKAPATAQSGKAPATQTGKTPAVAQTPAGKKPAGGNAAIVVAQGDTLFSLSRKYNTTVDALRQANGLGKKGNLKVGQKLMVP